MAQSTFFTNSGGYNPSLRNPKRNSSCNKGRTGWYPYYAGFSPEFVEDAINFARTCTSIDRILDPWNGSGTTTQVAHSQGILVDGFDLNPAMVLVAKAKTLHTDVRASLPSLLDDICFKAQNLRGIAQDDPLTAWLTERSASAVRSIDKAIFALLVDGKQYTPIGRLRSLSEVSALASFFYLALFRTLRTLLSVFIGSNPTWLRQPDEGTPLIDVEERQIVHHFRNHLLSMKATLLAEFARSFSVEPAPRIDVADSTALPVTSGGFDLIVSSPPYCTRIDYAIKTRAELAILGIDQKSFRSLRDEMLGTPTIADTPTRSSVEWGQSCAQLLKCISQHRAKASKSYYWKTYAQYFRGLFQSIREISRALRPSGLCFLVVQDSYYKDLWVDLATITNEMAAAVNLRLVHRANFTTRRTMIGLNTSSRIYNNTHAHTESVLLWERNSSGTMEQLHG
jgi:SAM-dependent methyltransferase